MEYAVLQEPFVKRSLGLWTLSTAVLVLATQFFLSHGMSNPVVGFQLQLLQGTALFRS